VRGLILHSGGIDSPVAAYIMVKAGFTLHAVHFEMKPFNETRFIAEKVMATLTTVVAGTIPLVVIPMGDAISQFLKVCGKEGKKYTCIFCKRMMYRIAEQIALNNECSFLVTGENLGQVASQTLTNIFVTSKAVDIPIVRPLIGLDKLDIISIAEDIGTYNISIQKKTQCTAVPAYPVVRAQLKRIEALEDTLDMTELIHTILDNTGASFSANQRDL
jgi:thiamine biosynthesis protein ThiI